LLPYTQAVNIASMYSTSMSQFKPVATAWQATISMLFIYNAVIWPCMVIQFPGLPRCVCIWHRSVIWHSKVALFTVSV